MNPFFETLGVIVLAVLGIRLGLSFSRWPKWYWSIGYALPLLFVVSVGLSRRLPALEFVPPISWLVAGRTEFALAALFIPMLFITPVSRLPKKRDRIATLIVMTVALAQISILPFFAPVLNRATLAKLETTIDSDGVCLQSTDYNCGPAAAVTALRRLGIQAEEGELAILARTTWLTGTPPDVLANAVQARFGREGVKTEYRRFRSISELDGLSPVIALVKFSFLLDHYVVVFEITEDHVVVGDPFRGKEKLTRQEFYERWRYSGVVLHKESSAGEPGGTAP